MPTTVAVNQVSEVSGTPHRAPCESRKKRHTGSHAVSGGNRKGLPEARIGRHLQFMTRIDPYNPLDLEALGGSLIRALESRSPEPLRSIGHFLGSGVYALYYVGREHPYAELGEFNRTHECRLPIYVGRAKDPGARQGISPFEPVTEPLLFSRVQEHKRLIKAVESAGSAHIMLRLDDFMVRALVCLPLWVPLAEAMALRLDRPLWNSALSGFGIHAPGKGREEQRRSQWDQLHAGRPFATRLPENDLSKEVLVEQAHTAAVERVSSAAVRLGLSLPPSLVPNFPVPTTPRL